MKAILMAAGIGSRIKDLTSNPKSLLNINGKSIIRNTVELLTNHNIKVIVVVGFKEELIRKELENFDIEIISNKEYINTNSIFSLYKAKDYLDDECIIANADVFWGEDILERILTLSKYKNSIMISDNSKNRLENGDYFFKVIDNKIVNYGKCLALEDRTHEYVGIAKIKKEFIHIFKNELEKNINEKNYNLWWEDVLYKLSSLYNIEVDNINGMIWGEVDTPKDYERLLEINK